MSGAGSTSRARGVGPRLAIAGLAQGSARRRAGAPADSVEDAGDRIVVEDRRDGLEASHAAMRAAAPIDVADPAEQVGPAQAWPVGPVVATGLGQPGTEPGLLTIARSNPGSVPESSRAPSPIVQLETMAPLAQAGLTAPAVAGQG